MIITTKTRSLLKILGLTDSEISVYTYLLERGSALSISDIAKGVGSFRPIIYKSLGVLLEKGLTSAALKGRRKLFIAEHPERLREILQDISANIEDVLPDLEAVYHKPEEGPSIKLLEGKRGISSVYSDIVNSLKRGDAFYRYTSSNDLAKAKEYLPKEYREKRDRKNLERYVIRNQATGTKERPDLNRNTKIIPFDFDLFDQNIIQFIYGNKVAIVDLNTQTSFIIENKKFADFQMKIFKLLYSKL